MFDDDSDGDDDDDDDNDDDEVMMKSASSVSRETPFTRYNRLSNRLNNRLHRVNRHSTGLTTGRIVCKRGLRRTVGQLCGHGVARAIAVDLFAGAGVKTVGTDTPVALESIDVRRTGHQDNTDHQHQQQQPTHLRTHRLMSSYKVSQ